ncbi:MAG: SPOR domain-containing protein [Hyphomicrobiaceae bacterium]
MTRSDNPFGDLPEWKERQRLQEAQGQAAGQPGHYHPSQEVGHGYAPQNGYPQDAGHFDNAAVHQASHQTPYYQEPSPAASTLHYNVATDGLTPAPAEYDSRPAAPMSTYDPNIQVTYPADMNRPLTPGYGDAAQAPGGYDAGHGQPSLGVGPDLREGYYDDRGQYHVLEQNGPAGAQHMPGYDVNTFGQGHADGAGYYEPATRSGGQWRTEPLPAQAPIGYDDDGEEDEDDYYDDDQDESRRYSWKLMAAVLVTGAVVTGGGVVLYDSFMGGGAGTSGETPIVRANQRPAKTAPADAGGRKFGNQDSKLLGRLDSSGNAQKAGAIEKSEVRNRVRSVPTVRIGPDGNLILPKAPEAAKVPTSAPVGKQAAEVGGQPLGPGINVVDSLGGRSVPGLGKLPQALPPATQPKVVNAARVPRQQPSATAVKPSRAEAAGQTAPVVTNRARANRATAPNAGLPPVPSKSSLGSAWRMTGAEAAAQKQPTVGAAIRPTIAQPAKPQARQPVAAPVQTASTLGAGTLVKPQRSKGFVAVLATAPTRMKALQSFAELQQKHPTALLNRVPDVQRADLSARGLGIMYRVVVGPAGPRKTANAVCSSLKSEGYKGCWVKNN